MANPSTLTAATVMNLAASLLNDAAKSVYTFAVQIPYLNMALQELQEAFELANIPVTTELSAIIEIDADVASVGYAPTPPIANTPYLPNDFVEPRLVWESTRDLNQWTPMTRVQQLPLYAEGVQIPQLLQYVWQSQRLTWLPADADNDIKVTYVKQLFTTITGSTDSIGVVNAASYLQFKTAALCARYVGENPTRADTLDIEAVAALDRAEGIGIKGQQSIITRRKPFRSGWKSRKSL